MSVEIWKGVCADRGHCYDTEVTAFRDPGKVFFSQVASDGDAEYIVMSESEAIDIALCILAELVPGMFYNLKKED